MTTIKNKFITKDTPKDLQLIFINACIQDPNITIIMDDFDDNECTDAEVVLKEYFNGYSVIYVDEFDGLDAWVDMSRFKGEYPQYKEFTNES